ncbi:hypothetical protein B0H14DRAFT_3434672 [Mycena olivaceomarginata]|nr:hypothetical protein B0H14DRAFT_3434672 [Mycena olivaceomarginata]
MSSSLATIPIPSPSPAGEGEPSHAPPSKKKLRELKLRADPLADVQGPTLVHCLGCGGAIKLSTKSDYDASHWLRHRARCAKKTGARGKPTSSASAASSSTGSPASSARALTPPDEHAIPDPDVADPDDPLDAEPEPEPIPFPDWQSWDWSKLKSRFASPV